MATSHMRWPAFLNGWDLGVRSRRALVFKQVRRRLHWRSERPSVYGKSRLAGPLGQRNREGGELAMPRGHCLADSLPVLSATPRQGPSDRSALKRLEHELALSGKLDRAWAPKPLELARRDAQAVLILEDLGGVPREIALTEQGISFAASATELASRARPVLVSDNPLIFATKAANQEF